MSRYSKLCPACQEWLTYSRQEVLASGVLSAVATIAIVRRLGPVPSWPILAPCFALLLWFGGICVLALLIPPKLIRVQGKAIGKGISLHLTDKPGRDKPSNS